MAKILLSQSAEARSAISALFENAPPVLVEVRFLHHGTSPDWYLYEEEDQLDQLLERLGPGAEVHLSSVWDLKNVKGEVLVKK